MTFAERLAEENKKVVAKKLHKVARRTPASVQTLEVRISGFGEVNAAYKLGATEVKHHSPAGVWQSWVPQYLAIFSRADLDSLAMTSV
jgi:hypothetical protein